MENEGDKDHDLRASAFYGATYQAWYQTRLEIDRTLIALASAGIGVLAALLAAFSKTAGYLQLLVASFGVSLFLVSITTNLRILRENGAYLESVLADDEKLARSQEARLETSERSARRCFVGGVLLTFMFGISFPMAILHREANNVEEGLEAITDQGINEEVGQGSRPKGEEKSERGLQPEAPQTEQSEHPARE